MSQMFRLYPEQQKAVDFTLANLDKPVALALPTAAGKTIVAKTLSDTLPGRTAIVTYSNQLVGQFYRTFPLPTVIGGSNYLTAQDKMLALLSADREKVVLFNPASYLLYMKREDSRPFDNIIIDEADACLGLFKILTPTSIPWSLNVTPSVETIVEQLRRENYDTFADSVLHHQNRYWWEVSTFYDKKTKTLKATLKIHNVLLKPSFAEKFLAKKVVLMSGTLFPSYCREILGTSDYHYYEVPSPIPVERRLIEGLTQDKGWVFPSDYEDMLSLLDVVLARYHERPAIVHTTYEDVRGMQALQAHLEGYQQKTEKMIALEAIDNTNKTLLTPGLIEGVDLKHNKARLNIILRGAFPNLGSDAVLKRKSLPDGNQWYIEAVLRSAIQAAGRTTRAPDDFSKIVIADCRLTRLIKENIGTCPNYFVEALRF